MPFHNKYFSNQPQNLAMPSLLFWSDQRLAWPHPGQALGLAQGQACKQCTPFCKGQTYENDFLRKITVFHQLWPFLDLLDLTNGSGSKFWLFWRYREVCTTKISTFHAQSVIHCVKIVGPPPNFVWSCPWLFSRNQPGQFLKNNTVGHTSVCSSMQHVGHALAICRL